MSDSPDFTPAPAGTRHDGWTPNRQSAFIAALTQHGGVAAAARSGGMTPQDARRLRKRPGATDFARAWDAPVEAGRFRALNDAIERGRDGWLVPITRNGKLVGHRRRLDRRFFAACYREPMRRYERR